MSKRIIYLIVVAAVVTASYSGIFTVREGKQALVFEMGHLQVQSNNQAKVLMPGLHFKLPLIETARQFDMRIQSLPLNVPVRLDNMGIDGTAEYVVNWHIADLPLFYQRTGGTWQQVNTLLTQQLTGHLNLANIATPTTDLQTQAEAIGKDFGITIVSLQYKGLVLSKNALTEVYQSMSDKQEQIAKGLRLNATMQADKIADDAQTQATVVLAQGRADASKLRADGDAQAAKIYADAYSKDPEFYTFLISLEAYVNTFNSQQDTLVLTPSMQFFNYFNQPMQK